MRVKVAIGFLALALAGFSPAEQTTPLQAILTRAAADFPGRAGIWVKHVTTGETAGVRDGEIFNSASVIKMPVLVMAFQMAERGELNLDERITIRKEDIRGGSGIFRYHDAGLQPTVRDVLLQMVITSDNTATDLSIAKVGGVAKVNAWLKQNGYADQKLTQTTGDLFAKYNALTPADDRNAKTNADKSYWLGEITPKGMGLMFEAHREEDHRLGGQLRRDAAHAARAAGRGPAAQSLHPGRRRAQDRRLPTGAGQRRRHHLRAVRTDRRVVPRQRHHRQLR